MENDFWSFSRGRINVFCGSSSAVEEDNKSLLCGYENQQPCQKVIYVFFSLYGGHIFSTTGLLVIST